MYKPYFNAVQTLINQYLTTVKTIDYYNRQYDRYKNLKAVKFPAIYVEFGKMDWQDASKGMKVSDAEITLHVVYKGVEDSPAKCLELASEVQAIFQGRSLQLSDLRISTGFTLTGSDLVTEYDQIKVMILKYRTMLQSRVIKTYATQAVELEADVELQNTQQVPSPTPYPNPDPDPQFEPESLLVFARMPGLSDFEKNVINYLIDDEKKSGTDNYAKADEYFLYGLLGSNAQKGFKSSNDGTIAQVTTQSANGFTTDGLSGFFDSGFNQQNDSEKFTQNDAFVSAFLLDASQLSGDSAIFGGRLTGSNGVLAFSTSSNNSIIYQINGGASTYSSGLLSNTMYTVSRKNSLAQQLMINGLEVHSDSKASSPLISQNIGVGANIQLIPAGAYLKGTLSALSVGGSIGFDHLAHNNNMRLAIASLIDGNIIRDVNQANNIIENA